MSSTYSIRFPCSISFSSARASKIAHRVRIESLNQNIELAAQRVLGVSFSTDILKSQFFCII